MSARVLVVCNTRILCYIFALTGCRGCIKKTLNMTPPNIDAIVKDLTNTNTNTKLQVLESAVRDFIRADDMNEFDRDDKLNTLEKLVNGDRVLVLD